MNIKFRMPRWGSKLKGRPMLKEMAMTVIATTISIVLTFGSASVVEQRQKENNRRQTVMMVIHDIEDNIKVLKGWKSKEETNITLSNYVLSHLDEIDVIFSKGKRVNSMFWTIQWRNFFRTICLHGAVWMIT